jgi:amidohydrolase
MPKYIYRSACLVLITTLSAFAWTQIPPVSKEIYAAYPEAYALYLELHQNPELSSHETQTAAKLANHLRGLGYDVTEHIGGTGIVAILKNGEGPVVMLRAELDALPIEEKTGLPYASRVHAKDDSGRDVSVMHACGHDLHMASLLGTAAVMARTKDNWRGTLMLLGQPAEETGVGAKKMINDGFLKRFPKPEAGVALHVTSEFPAGKIGIASGYGFSSADSLRITIYGKGGHASVPHNTIDPVVIAAKTVLALQLIISREIKPGEAAVVTVGYIQAGTKNNIIPDEAYLGLTVRTYKPEIRRQILAAIARITKAEAQAGGALREPLIEQYEATDAVYNDPTLANELRGSLEAVLGKDNVVTAEPVMASEDFSNFIAEGIHSFYFFLGGADPQKYAQAKATSETLPDTHSSVFAPDADPALHAGIAAEVAILRRLLK